jgi:hypothetical protein
LRSRPDSRGASEALGRLPLAFESSQGQLDGSVKFIARGGDYKACLTATGAELKFAGERESALKISFMGSSKAPACPGSTNCPERLIT